MDSPPLAEPCLVDTDLAKTDLCRVCRHSHFKQVVFEKLHLLRIDVVLAGGTGVRMFRLEKRSG